MCGETNRDTKVRDIPGAGANNTLSFIGYQNPRVKGKCVGHRTEGTGLVKVGQTRAMFKASFLYVCR